MKYHPLLYWLVAIVPLTLGHPNEGTTYKRDLKSSSKNQRKWADMTQHRRFSRHTEMAVSDFRKAKRMAENYVPGMTNNYEVGRMTPNYPAAMNGMNNGYVSGASHVNSGNGDAVVGGTAADALKTFYNIMDGHNVNFGYRIDDPMTSNRQARYEKGNPKDEVTGSYSIQEPDGTMRIVYYVADWVNGFRATVTDKDGMRRYGGVSRNRTNMEHGQASPAGMTY